MSRGRLFFWGAFIPSNLVIIHIAHRSSTTVAEAIRKGSANYLSDSF